MFQSYSHGSHEGLPLRANNSDSRWVRRDHRSSKTLGIEFAMSSCA